MRVKEGIGIFILISIIFTLITTLAGAKSQQRKLIEDDKTKPPIEQTQNVNQGNSNKIIPTDLNQDGLMDLVIIDKDLSVRFLQGRGEDGFEDNTLKSGLVLKAKDLFLEDLNADGLIDILGLGKKSTLMLNQGEGIFENRTYYAGLGQSAEQVYFVDYDQDGYRDLILQQAKGVMVLRNSGEKDLRFAVRYEEKEAAELVDGAQLTTNELDPSAEVAAQDAAEQSADFVQANNALLAADRPDSSNSSSAKSGAQPNNKLGPSNKTANAGGACAASVTDANGGGCISASSTPTMGMLYPLSQALFIENATNRIGVGTTVPGNAAFKVENNAPDDLTGYFVMTSTTSGRTGVRSDVAGSGNAIYGLNTGTGRAGNFLINNASSAAEGLYTESIGTGPSLYAFKNASSSGHAANFVSDNNSHALKVESTGTTGRAGFFNISNNASTASALYIKTSGSGYALEVNKGSVATVGSAAYFSSGGGGGKNPDPTITAVNSTAGAMAGWFGGGMYVAGKLGIGTETPTEKLEVNGNAIINGTATTDVLTITGGSDLAEPFEILGANILPGMVVSIDPENPGKLRLADKSYDSKVIGAISGANGIRPGMTMSQAGILDGSHPVALAGRIYVLADASYGAIEAGDLLTSCETVGHARKAENTQQAVGAIIGKALTPLAQGKGLVLMVISAK